MKSFILIIVVLIYHIGFGQSFDTSRYSITVESSAETNRFFTNDPVWRGADGASAIDLENGKILWLFSDGFISADSSGSRKNAPIIRNSIAIQNGHDLATATLKFYWDNSQKEPQAFFHKPGRSWFWMGHGVMIKDKLLIFLMKEHAVKTGFGFETFGWCAVLISNPTDEPPKWKMKYIEGPDTYGTIAGSAAVLKDKQYVYAYGAEEPGSHDVYLLRWKTADLYSGNLSRAEWWQNGKWVKRKKNDSSSRPLFTGSTEFSVHYDTALKKYIQVQSFGFGEATIGLRLSDSLQGPWTKPYIFYTPQYQGIKEPFMYSAKAHPELRGNGVYITYNINSFDFNELVDNQAIYFPKFVLIKITRKNSP